MHVVAMIAILGLSGTDLPACEGFAGTYQDVGVVEHASGALPKGGDVSLSRAVFRQAMPGLARPETVVLTVSAHSPVLRVTLAGKERFEMEWPVTCADGEYRIDRSSKNLSAGEGVELVRGAETIVLKPDAAGLSVRLISEARYRTWPFFYRTEKYDDRYRFLRKPP